MASNKKKNIDVSIIVPVYNVENYIEECLQSIANQMTTKGVECILIDDCGADNSTTIAQSFIESYEGEIKYSIICHEKNSGLSAARNTGIKAASGEYIYFLDSDDTITPNCIRDLLSLANTYGGVDLLPALYICNSMEQFGKHSFPEFSSDRRLIKRSLLNYDLIPVTAANRLIRRSLIVDNNIWFKEGIIHEDNHWMFFLAKHVKRMAFTPQRLYYYRETPNSITKKKNRKKESASFNFMIRDFCNNIDTFEIGAQKRWIFLHLLQMKDSMYYESVVQMKYLENLFLNVNSFVERILLLFSIRLNMGKLMRSKVINLLQKIYLMN